MKNSNYCLYAARKQRYLNLFFATFVLLLSVYLIWPCFKSVHVEGFTAQVESISLLRSLSPHLEHDPYLPLITKYIFQTRSGVVDILTTIYRIFPNAGDVAFRAVILVSFVVLVFSSIIFAKRWGRVPAIYAFSALILTQGIPETAFFFNDNIISAAFAVSALLFIHHKPHLLHCVFSGFLLGFSILCRLDAIFIIPIIIGTVGHVVPHWRGRWLTVCGIGLSTVVFLIGQYLIQGFSLVDAFITAKKFTGMFQKLDLHAWIIIRLYFFGLIALPLLIVSTWILFKQYKISKHYFAMATFTGYPFLLILAAPMVTEIRYIFPLLSPLIALVGGSGLQGLYRQASNSDAPYKNRCRVAVVAAVVIMLLPPSNLVVRDGPRSLVGRLWTPTLWRQWQDSVDLSSQHARQLVADLERVPTAILISTHWNDEFYIRLRLMEAGFKPEPASVDFPGCKGFSLFTKDYHTVIHIRTEPEYRMAPISKPFNAALQISNTLSCALLPANVNVYLSAFGDNDKGDVSPVIYSGAFTQFPKPYTVEFFDSIKYIRKHAQHKSYGIVNYRQLEPGEVSDIINRAWNYMRQYPEIFPKTGKPLTIDDYYSLYR